MGLALAFPAFLAFPLPKSASREKPLSVFRDFRLIYTGALVSGPLGWCLILPSAVSVVFQPFGQQVLVIICQICKRLLLQQNKMQSIFGGVMLVVAENRCFLSIIIKHRYSLQYRYIYPSHIHSRFNRRSSTTNLYLNLYSVALHLTEMLRNK